MNHHSIRSRIYATACAFMFFATMTVQADKTIQEALLEAVINNDAPMAKQMLRAGANSNIELTVKTDTSPLTTITLLYMAAMWGFTNVAQVLLEHGADLEKGTGIDGASPLFIAADQGHADTVTFLLSKGANAYFTRPNYNEKWTPLHRAARYGHTAAVQALLDHGVPIDLPLYNGQTPLMCAVIHKRRDTAQLLLYRGAKINAQLTVDGFTALHTAAEYGFDDMALLLVQNEVDVNTLTFSGRTPLHFAALALHKTATSKHLETAQLLLDSDALVDVADKSGNTPLFLAALCNNPEIAQLLVSRGANIETALALAEKLDATEAIKILQSLLKNHTDETPKAIPAAASLSEELQAATLEQ